MTTAIEDYAKDHQDADGILHYSHFPADAKFNNFKYSGPRTPAPAFEHSCMDNDFLYNTFEDVRISMPVVDVFHFVGEGETVCYMDPEVDLSASAFASIKRIEFPTTKARLCPPCNLRIRENLL